MTPTAFAAFPQPHGGAIGQKYAFGVDGHIEIPLVLGQIANAIHGGHPGIGADDVEAPERRHREDEGVLDGTR
jgi:hypothetical protein